MTRLLDQAIEQVRRLPPERQDEAAEVLLSIAGQDPGRVQLTEAQREEVTRRLREVPDHASELEAAEAYKKLGA